jgi:NitT/TauT family transport system permease protein
MVRDIARRLLRLAVFPAFLAALILLWQASIGWFSVPAYILQRPSDIVINAAADLPRLLAYTLVTASETLVGFAAAILAGVPLGLAIVTSALMRRTIYPLCVSLEMVPKIAFAPLFIAWFGFGLFPKIVVVFLVCFFPVVLNAMAGFAALPEELVRFSATTGATSWRKFVKLRLPAALPQCFVGFKFAAVNATVGATIAEFIGSDQGLGFYIQIQTGNMRPDLAFAAIFILALLGLALFGAVTLAERAAIPWDIAQRRLRGAVRS